MLIDDPEVLAEVQEEFDRYERALVANDREALVEFFLDSPTTVRYGERVAFDPRPRASGDTRSEVI